MEALIGVLEPEALAAGLWPTRDKRQRPQRHVHADVQHALGYGVAVNAPLQLVWDGKTVSCH